MSGPEEYNPSRDTPSAEQKPEYGIADWAEVIAVDPVISTGRPDGLDFRRDADWSSDGMYRYEFSRRSECPDPNEGPVTHYRLEVYKDFSRTFTGYKYDSRTGRVRKCDMRWRDVPGAVDPFAYADEMLSHLKTAPVDPSVSPVAPTNIMDVLLQMAEREGLPGLEDEVVRSMQPHFKLARRVAQALGRLFGQRSKPGDTN